MACIIDGDGSHGGRLIVEVIDSGIGIEPEKLPRIFDTFEQGGPSVTRRFGGLGLGLAISRTIVELHGGKLSARSDGKDRGSTFTVELSTVPGPRPEPRSGGKPRDRAIPSSVPGDARSNRPASLRLLFVEDNHDTMNVMVRLLTRSGHRVTSASTLADALSAARRQQFDLVISDIDLPDGNGLELMRQLRHVQPIEGIALSGLGMEADLRKSREAGFSDHLIKPVDYPRLERRIQELAQTTATPQP